MTATVRAMKRKAAKRPAPRTVTFTAPEDSDYAGWEVTAKADFPAKVLIQLQSERMTDIIAALDRIVVSHNLPDENDDIAESMGEVDPYDGLMDMATGVFDALSKLPNR